METESKEIEISEADKNSADMNFIKKITSKSEGNVPSTPRHGSDGGAQNYGALLDPNDALIARKIELGSNKINTTVEFVKKILKHKIK